MFQRLVAGGVAAGFAAGLIAALLQFSFVQQPLLMGERYESGALVHFPGSGPDSSAAHSSPRDAGHGHAADAGHDEAAHHDGGGETPGWQRNGLTVLFTALIYTAYGLLLMVGFRLAEMAGRVISPAAGVIWGVAGFAAFQMAPAMGLPPELPGTIAAEFQLRQAWWLGTVAASIAGLGLIGLAGSPLAVLAGLVLLAAPHVIGAPAPDRFWGVAPPELASEFAARSLGVGLAAWTVLGWLGARLWSRAA